MREYDEDDYSTRRYDEDDYNTRRYDEDDYNTRRYAPVLRRVIIVVAVIIAVPMMMWTITIFIRSYVERPHLAFDRDRTSSYAPSLPAKPQAAQRAPAPLLTDAAGTAGDGLASLPDPPAETALNAPAEALTPEPIRGGLAAPLPEPNSESLRGSLAQPPGDAPPPAASPTRPAETAPNAPAVASGEAAAVTNSAHSVATAETASSEAVTPVQRNRLTATGSMAPVGPVPLPRVRPVDAPVDTPPVPSSPLSGSPLLAHPAAYGWPGLESVH